MTDSLDFSNKITYQVVKFVHSGGSKFFTDWTSEVPYAGNNYVSTPDMEVTLPENDGLLGEKICSIAVPLSADPNDFTVRMVSGTPHAGVQVTVREIIKSLTPGPATVVNTTFIGEIDKALKNYRGRKGKVLFKCVPKKAQWSTVSVGVPCTVSCDNNLGDADCQVDMTGIPRKVPATIASVDGRTLTISSNATIEAQADRFYHRGYINYQGLNIAIRDWRDSGPLTFLMVDIVPDYWDGAGVFVFSGCDKSITTCRNRYSNEDNFNGSGIKMPPYHPNFEDSP